MFKDIRFYLVVSVCITVLSTGCKKWVDVNYDPSQLSDENATPDLILPAFIYDEMLPTVNQYRMAEWMGYWCKPDNVSSDPLVTYNILDAKDFPGGAVAGPDDILFEQNARNHNQPYYLGIAKFFKALDFSGSVDTYNDVPYREAFNINIRSPHYDKGQFIYEDLMVQLDSALLLIKNARQDQAIHISNSDIMFHGDKNKWYRVINTLKLRLLIHQANRAERKDYIAGQIAKIVQEGSGFLPSGGDAAVNPGFTEQKPSPYFSNNSAFDDYPRSFIGTDPAWVAASANTAAMDLLKSNDDPRLGFFYNPAQTPLPPGATEPFTQPAPVQYRGNRLGLTIDQLAYPFQGTNYISQVGGVQQKGVAVSPASTGLVKGYDMDCWVITSVESLFLQAEAIQRGWLPGDPEAAYQAAVRESFRWLNVGGNSANPQLSDDAFNSWYATEASNGNASVSWDAAADKYKLLMFQKYLALNGIDPYQSYVDYRRNGLYPNIPISYCGGRVGNQIPIRSPYPVTEYAQNAANVNAEGPINIFTSKIWWMP
jgi:hypothetical protein